MSSEDGPKDVIELVDKLVKSISSSEIDRDNLRRCADFVLRHIYSNKYSIPSKTQTQNLLEIYATKYDYLGFVHYAEELSSCVNGYTELENDKNDKLENKWRMLEFLCKMSNDAFKADNLYTLEDKLKVSRNVTYPEEITEEEYIDWYQYLREGSERFRIPSDEESDEESFISQLSLKDNESKRTKSPLYNDLFKGFNTMETLVPDEKSSFLAALKESVESKNWLSERKQHTWWCNFHCSTPESQFPAASFGIDWDKAQNTIIYSSVEVHPTKNQYYTEYKIIRELLWLLIVNDKQRISKRIEFIRSQVSATSLIQETFSSFISDVLDTALKYHEIKSFQDEISSAVLQFPFTYQAYSSALADICKPFILKVVELEDDVRQQDDIYTLLKVKSHLIPYLQEINFIYRIHSSNLHPNWLNEPAWLVTIQLLSYVYSSLESVLVQFQVHILLKIFFKTFKVYADLIDRWLTEGKIDDWKNEFYIKRSDDGTCTVFPYDDSSKIHITVAPFFHKMAERLLSCSKNVDFLCKLNKFTELKSQIFQQGPFISIFVKEFLKRISNEKDYMNLSVREKNQELVPLQKEQIEFFSQEKFNPYLVRAFAEQVKTEAPMQKIDVLDQLDSISDVEIVSVHVLLEDALYEVINKRETTIVDLFKSSLVQEYRLFDHIRNLSDFLLMDLHGFCSRINLRLDRKIWEGNHLIKVFLHGCVETNKLPFGHLFHFVLNQDDQYTENVNVCVSEIIRVIDCVHLHYMVQWPMNMIFNENIVKNFYEKLFKLVLKMNVAFSSVTRLCYKDLPFCKLFALRSRRMYLFRYWVVQLLSKMKSYLSLIISQCLDFKLIEKNIKINTFDSLQTHYTEYLESVKTQCLIKTEISNSLENAFNRVWNVCDHVRDLWNKSMKLLLTDEDVTRSVELYVNCSWYLTEVLGKFANGRPIDDPLHYLWLDLSHMVQVHRSTIPEDLQFQSEETLVLHRIIATNSSFYSNISSLHTTIMHRLLIHYIVASRE